MKTFDRIYEWGKGLPEIRRGIFGFVVLIAVIATMPLWVPVMLGNAFLEGD